MSRARLSSTSVKLPFLGIDTTWELSRLEQSAAWKLLVELVLRTSSADMADVNGSDQEALDSLKALVASIRTILTEQGVDTAPNRGDGSLSFAAVAVRLLNDVLRPFTVRWTPQLDNHHAKRPPLLGVAEWEATQWGGFGAPLHVAFRRELSDVRNQLRSYVFVIARAARTVEFGAVVEGGRSGELAGEAIFAAVDVIRRDGAKLVGKPRRHMVRWFDPVEVAPTGWKQMRTKQSGDDRDASADDRTEDGKRTLQVGEYGNEVGGVWFDYIADMGDAFDPTMQVAWTAGRATLYLQPGASPTELPRGELLILGGDEVYPHGSEKRYRNHLRLPYENAFEAPCTSTADVVAIPGNHDWAGGLDPWRRVFCGDRPFGRWATRQHTSWWSAKLTGGWWVWGIDTFLDGTINDRQRTDFAIAASQLGAGDQVILCTPVPLWRLREKNPTELSVIEEFVRDLVGSRRAVVRVCLSGDSHVFAAYRRHRSSGPEELHVTSGGGGAFLHPTHNLSRVIPQTDLGRADESLIDPAPFVDGVFWPPPSASFTRNVRTVAKAVSDRQSPALMVMLGLLHSLYTLLVVRGLHGNAVSSGVAGSASRVRQLLTQNPGALTTFTLAVVVIVVCAFGVARPNTAEPGVKRAARRAGAMHGLAQTVGFVIVAVGAHTVVRVFSSATAWVTALAAFLPGGVVGSLILISYLVRVNRSKRVNDNEAFSARHFSDAKHFLRCHIDPTGKLTIFLVAIERTRSGWFDAMREGKPLPPGITSTTSTSTQESSAVSTVEVARVAWRTTVSPYVAPATFSGSVVSRRVAVAISNAPESSEFERTSLDTLFLQLCETMLAAGFEVAHGGDHRRGGFIAQLGQAASGSIGYRGGRVVNYLTTSDRATTERTGFIEGVAVEEVKVEPVANEPADVTRSRELSEMRSRMTMESLGRVVACGRILGSQGVAPGVLEEAYGSMVAKRPVYVVGGFRGAAEVIANAIRGEADLEVRAALSTDEGYVRRLAAVASSVTANTMLDAFKTAGPGGLNNGLGEPDNLLLLASTDRAQIVRLIMSGLRQVAANC